MAIGYFIGGIVAGVIIGLVTVGIFYRPDRVRGATARAIQFLWGLEFVVIPILLIGWAIGAQMPGNVGRPAEPNAALWGQAVGYIILAATLAIHRRRRAQRLMEAKKVAKVDQESR